MLVPLWQQNLTGTDEAEFLLRDSGMYPEISLKSGSGYWNIWDFDELPCDCCHECNICRNCLYLSIDGTVYRLIRNVLNGACWDYKWDQASGTGSQWNEIPHVMPYCGGVCSGSEVEILLFTVTCCDNGDGTATVTVNGSLICDTLPVAYPYPDPSPVLKGGLGEFTPTLECDDPCESETVDITDIVGEPTPPTLCTVDLELCYSPCCEGNDELFLCFVNPWLSYAEKSSSDLDGHRIWIVTITCDLTGDEMDYQLKPLDCTTNDCEFEDLTGHQLGACDIGQMWYGNDATCIGSGRCDPDPICDRDALQVKGVDYAYVGIAAIGLHDQNLAGDFMVRMCFTVDPGTDLSGGANPTNSPQNHGMLLGLFNGGELGGFALHYDHSSQKFVLTLDGQTYELAVTTAVEDGLGHEVYLYRIGGTITLDVDDATWEDDLVEDSTDWYTLKWLGVEADLLPYRDHNCTIVEISE
jgi:hypothetical protein